MYTIHPYRTAAMPGVCKGMMFTYLVDNDVTMTIPVIAYLVLAEDDDTVILVDTGVDPDNYEEDRGIADGTAAEHRDALAEHDLTPADVDYVIMTHLHNDHVGHMDLFPDAEFLVQRSELAAIRDPLPHQAFAYSESTIETLETLDVTPVDGGYRLREGIELLHTPGHTKGMQVVIVETAAGPHGLVSDMAYCEHNLDPSLETIPDANGEPVAVTPRAEEYLLPGLHVDTEDCYRSYERVTERLGPDGVWLGGHAASVLGNSYPL
jgi:glyoxylase-like metal-dependent hydrolase (beta-lactamase superfamily II)